MILLIHPPFVQEQGVWNNYQLLGWRHKRLMYRKRLMCRVGRLRLILWRTGFLVYSLIISFLTTCMVGLYFPATSFVASNRYLLREDTSWAYRVYKVLHFHIFIIFIFCEWIYLWEISNCNLIWLDETCS